MLIISKALCSKTAISQNLWNLRCGYLAHFPARAANRRALSNMVACGHMEQYKGAEIKLEHSVPHMPAFPGLGDYVSVETSHIGYLCSSQMSN